MKFDIPGLLSRIAGLPGAINQGLLGNLPVNPNLGLDSGSLSQARQSALTDFATGMLAAPSRNPGLGLAAARQNAQGNYRERILDIMRENETSRLMRERDERQRNEEQYISGLPAEVQPVARVAGAQGVAQQQIGSMFAPAEQQLTDDIKEYNLAVEQGYTGSIQDWIMGQKRASAPQTNVNLPPQETELMKAIGKGRGEQFVTSFNSAKSAVSTLEQMDLLEPLVNSPNFISGPLGETRLMVAKVLGLPGAEETQAYFAAVGRQVGENIKLFGAGTGLSDADREFAKQMAAGSIELTPSAVKRIMRINRQVSQDVIKTYNQDRDFLGGKRSEVYDLYPSISAPGAIKIKRIK